MSPELLKAIHMVDAQETMVINTMMLASEEQWDSAWKVADRMYKDVERPGVQLLGMLALYGWNQARVKCAQRAEDAVG